MKEQRMKQKIAFLLLVTLLTSLLFGSCQTVEKTPDLQATVTDLEGTTQGENKDETEGDSTPCPTDEDHADTDNNGVCDFCSSSVVIILDLFAINDLHGKLCDSDKQNGVDEMTTYLKNAYVLNDHVLLLSSGDMWQGSSESNLTKGNIVTEWMNELGIVSMTLGNHEYDWGEAYIEQNAALADFPFLAINVFDSETNERASYCHPSVTVQKGGATIGIIGAIGDCHSSISGEVSGDFYFKTGNELTSLVREEAQRLRAAGADFIVYSIHDGYNKSSTQENISESQLRPYYDLILSDGCVDIVFEGHSHQSYVMSDASGVYHLQGGGDNRGLCHAEAVINFANGSNYVQQAEFIPSSTYANEEKDPIVVWLMEKYEDLVSIGTRVLGNNRTYRNGNNLCDLIAELYVQAGVATFGKDYPIVLGGGFLSARSPYNLPAGEVTYAQLQTLFPFDNDLVLCSVKGADLLSKFINTTNKNYHVSYSDYGESIKESIDPNATYYVLVDTYTSTYPSNRLTEIARDTPGVYARDLLATYVEKGGLAS